MLTEQKQETHKKQPHTTSCRFLPGLHTCLGTRHPACRILGPAAGFVMVEVADSTVCIVCSYVPGVDASSPWFTNSKIPPFSSNDRYFAVQSQSVSPGIGRNKQALKMQHVPPTCHSNRIASSPWTICASAVCISRPWLSLMKQAHSVAA